MAGTGDIYYTPETLAERWQCSKFTVYELLKKGALRGFKLGRDWRITDAARRAYEENPMNAVADTYRIKNGTRKTEMRIK